METSDKKLDLLFREGLDPIEITPSPRAWSQVNKSIQGKRQSSRIIWRIAAAVALAILWVGLLQDNQTQKMPAEPLASVDNPAPSATDSPFPAIPDSGTSVKATKAQVRIAQVENVETRKASEPLPVMELKSFTYVSLQAHLDVKLNPINNQEATDEKTPMVTITYIASSETSKETLPSEPGKPIGKLLEYAQKISPGDIIADIRDAKNDILEFGKRN